MIMSENKILIGLAGGTGSGKTSVAKAITADFDASDVALIEQDSYYKCLAHLPFEERVTKNFDHPDSMDFEEMSAHIRSLMAGEPVEVPIYDHASHTRTGETRSFGCQHIIIVEGIFALFDKNLRNMMDIKIFVDIPDDVRIIRRIQRDRKERGREVDQVIDQYYANVRPMHKQFCEPTKRYADIIVPEGAYNTVAIDLLRTKIGSLLESRNS